MKPSLEDLELTKAHALSLVTVFFREADRLEAPLYAVAVALASIWRSASVQRPGITREEFDEVVIDTLRILDDSATRKDETS